MLIRHLQELLKDGIVVRRTEGGRSGLGRYAISEHGRSLGPIMALICEWGHQHIKRMKGDQFR